MARQIQLSILPHTLPKLQGLDIAARFLPMTSVAGDFYISSKSTTLPRHPHRGCFWPRPAFRSDRLHAPGGPDRAGEPRRASRKGIVGSESRSLRQVHIQFCYRGLRLRGLGKQLHAVRRWGHPPLLLCRASSGIAAKVLENGLILGMFPEATYEALELPLEAGDRIALYTDGVLKLQIQLRSSLAQTASCASWKTIRACVRINLPMHS